MPSCPTTVRLYSYGVGITPWESPEEEADRLKTELAGRGLEEVDILLDARCFRDPGATESGLNGHTGRNPHIMCNLVHHSDFENWLLAAKLQFERCLRLRGKLANFAGVIIIVVYCRSGKHRSVAVCHVLRHILNEQTTHKLRAEDPVDLMCTSWGRKCCYGVCPECISMPPCRQAALIRALTFWQ